MFQIKVKRYSTQVSAAKKLERNAVQSESIRKFLAKKELEEKQKKDSDKMKKEVKMDSLVSLLGLFHSCMCCRNF